MIKPKIIQVQDDQEFWIEFETIIKPQIVIKHTQKYIFKWGNKLMEKVIMQNEK
jgi:hypothetical protein